MDMYVNIQLSNMQLASATRCDPPLPAHARAVVI